MRRSLTIVVLLLVLAVSLGLYRLESEVKILERRLTNVTTQLEENRRNSRILAAEWSFMSQPSRLQALARRHLDLVDLAPAQVSQLAHLPLKTPYLKTLPGDESSDTAAVPDTAPTAAPSGQPPVPELKPAKPQRSQPKRGRIVLAEGRRDDQ